MFKRTLQRYGQTAALSTPYQKAGQVWDARIGEPRVQARNWRLVALGAIAVAAIQALGTIWLSQQSRVVPYVVEVDRLGAAQAMGQLTAHFEPSDTQIAYFLARFIVDVRSLSSDPVVVRNNWLEAFAFATDHGSAFLSDFAQRNDPFKAIGTRTVLVQVTSVVRVSEKSFQVKWSEQIFDHDVLARAEAWTAILSVVVKDPPNAEVLRKNPLGLYVDAINWSRELSPNDVP